MSKPSDRKRARRQVKLKQRRHAEQQVLDSVARARQRPPLSAQEFAGAVECAIGKVVVNGRPHVVLTANAEGWFLCMDGEVADYVPARSDGFLALLKISAALFDQGADVHLWILDGGTWLDLDAEALDEPAGQTTDSSVTLHVQQATSEQWAWLVAGGDDPLIGGAGYDTEAEAREAGEVEFAHQRLVEELGASAARAHASVDAAIEAVERSEARFDAAEIFAAKIQDARPE